MRIIDNIKKLFRLGVKSSKLVDIPVEGLTFAIRNPKTGRKEIRCSDGVHSREECPKLAEAGSVKSAPTTIDELE